MKLPPASAKPFNDADDSAELHRGSSINPPCALEGSRVTDEQTTPQTEEKTEPETAPTTGEGTDKPADQPTGEPEE